jgi:hypothetical protein
MTNVKTPQTVRFSVTVQQDVSVQESPPEALHTPAAFLLISVSAFAAAVCIVVFVLTRIVRRVGRSARELNLFWWEDVEARKELMS